MLLVDQGTKALVRGSIAAGEQRDVLGPLSFVDVHNRGVAFGFLGGGGAIVLVVTFAALALLLVYFARHADRPLLWLPTGLVLGGALGNLVDRLHQGYVTDFIHFPHWPAFNVADMCITGGVVALVLVLELGGSPLRIEVDAAAEGERLDQLLVAAGGIGSRAKAQRLIEAGLVTVDGAAAPEAPPRGRRASWSRSRRSLRPRASRARSRTCRSRRCGRTSTCSSSTSRRASSCTRRAATAARRSRRRSPVAPPAGRTRRARGSSTGSTRTRPALLVVAKSEDVHRALQEAIRQRELRREYLALVEGCPPARSGTIDAPIGRDRRVRTRMSTDTDVPRAARTHFELERALAGYALLRVTLETGRTHQIRVHLQAIGHPVAGDPEYGRAGRARASTRQFLHAARLAFAHPVTGEPVDVSSPLPPDLAAVLAGLRRDGGTV